MNTVPRRLDPLLHSSSGALSVSSNSSDEATNHCSRQQLPIGGCSQFASCCSASSHWDFFHSWDKTSFPSWMQGCCGCTFADVGDCGRRRQLVCANRSRTLCTDNFRRDVCNALTQ